MTVVLDTLKLWRDCSRSGQQPEVRWGTLMTSPPVSTHPNLLAVWEETILLACLASVTSTHNPFHTMSSSNSLSKCVFKGISLQIALWKAYKQASLEKWGWMVGGGCVSLRVKQKKTSMLSFMRLFLPMLLFFSINLLWDWLRDFQDLSL